MTISNISEILDAGFVALEDKRNREEEAKLGILRGGTTGTVLPSGEHTDGCLRLAYLRRTGFSVNKSADEVKTLQLLQLYGRSIEKIVSEIIQAGLDDALQFIPESEVGVVGQMGGNITSGRPDGFLARRDGGKIEIALEIKGVASIWTTRNLLIDNEVKTKYLCQVGTYLMLLSQKLGYSPKYKILEVQPTIQGGADWLLKKIGEKRPESVNLGQRGQPTSIKPFILPFDVEFRAGVLYYGPEGEELQKTLVTQAGLNKYYETLGNFTSASPLPGPPKNIDPISGKLGYNLCGYCPLNSVCGAKTSQTMGEWVLELNHEGLISQVTGRAAKGE